MSTYQVILRNLICFDKFKSVEAHFKTVLNLVKNAGFYNSLNTGTRIFTKRVEKFYVNSFYANRVITTKVRDITLTYDVVKINNLIGFLIERALNFKDINVK